MSSRLAFATWVGGGAALLVAGCGRAPADPAAPDRVSVGLSPVISAAPFFIAEAEGYFRDQGIEIETISYRRSADYVPALAQGRLDVLSGSINAGLFNVIARGALVRVVADRGQWPSEGPPYSAILVRRAVFESGALADPARLRQLRFDTNKDNMQGFFCDRALRPHGVRLDEMNLQFVPDQSLPDAFRQGVLDLTATTEPWLSRVLDTGEAVVWVKDSEVVAGRQLSVVAFGPALLRDRPDVGRRFMIAYLRAVRQYAQGKTERHVDIIAGATGQDPELVRRVCWIPLAADGRINVQSVMDFQAWVAGRGFVDRILEPAEFWAPSFVDAAVAVLNAGSRPAGEP